MLYFLLLLVPWFIVTIVYAGLYLRANPRANDGYVFVASLVWPISLVFVILWGVYRAGVRAIYELPDQRRARLLVDRDVTDTPPPEPIRAPAVIPGASLIPPLLPDPGEEEEDQETEEVEVGKGKRRGSGR